MKRIFAAIICITLCFGILVPTNVIYADGNDFGITVNLERVYADYEQQ